MTAMPCLRFWPLVLLVCVGCTPSVPTAGFARVQPLPTAVGAWTNADARCLVEMPTRRISCRAIIKRQADGAVRLALITDEGPLLCDVTADQTGATVHQTIPDLTKAAPWLGRAAWLAWGQPSTPGEPIWDDDRLRLNQPDVTRWYGGDPLLLRRVDMGMSTVVIGDYRLLDGQLRPHRADLMAPLMSISLRLAVPEKTAPESTTP
jgi:hypothetical protein